MWRSEGIKGFYKVLSVHFFIVFFTKCCLSLTVSGSQGFVPGLFGVTHGALQFMAYEELKKFRSQYYGTHVDQKLVSEFQKKMMKIDFTYTNLTCFLSLE